MIIERLTDSTGPVEVGSRALFVPWAYAADCGKLPWDTTARWVPPGARGVLWGTPRLEEHWVNGLVTFDAFGWHAPYPQGRFLQYERLARGTDRDDWLPVEDVWTLVALVPTSTNGTADASEVGAAVNAWAEAHPELTVRFPANLVMSWMTWAGNRE